MARSSNQRSAKPAPKIVARTETRNSAIPRSASPGRDATASRGYSSATAQQPITHDQIARRAYEIWSSGKGGSEFDNWIRAERELRGR